MPEQKNKLAFFLPNIFTALNMACGFAAIIFALNSDFEKACLILILGAIFDMVDGRLARLLGTASHFGEQFDSLSDLVSFGVAPAFIFYHKFLINYGRAGLVLTFIFILCGALRLARFNANIEKVSSNFFQGLPVPVAALGIIGFMFCALEFNITNDYGASLIYIFIYSFMMISNIPFPSFKKSDWVKKHRKGVLLLIFLVLSSFVIYGEFIIGGVTSLYVLGSIIYYFTHKGQFQDMFHWKSETREGK